MRTSLPTIDSSNLSDYMRCPRYYFYRHIVGWEYEGKNINLIFGEAWHRAKEVILIEGTSDDTIMKASGAFLEYYRQFYLEATDMDNHPKNPANAIQALVEYQKQYGRNDDYKVVYIDGQPVTEIYGSVLVGEGRPYYFRMDAIVQNKNGLYMYIDHKTSGSDNPTYQKAYSLSMQMLSYYHALNCLFRPSEVYGGLVELTIFRKKGNLHLRLPIRKTLPIMEGWLWRVNVWIDRLYRDMDMLQTCKEDESIMKAFSENDKGCIAYNRMCKYHDFCTSWANPLCRIDHIPSGYKEDWWNPGDREKEEKFIKVGG